MTHDELTKQLEGLWHDSYKAPGYQALRAVVELHKPIEQDSVHLFCKECSSGWEKYPCKTIQAIEKELS